MKLRGLDLGRGLNGVIGRRLLVLLGILMLLAGAVAFFLGLGLIGFVGTGGAIALCMGFAFLGLALGVGGAVLVRRIFRTRGTPNTLVGGLARILARTPTF